MLRVVGERKAVGQKRLVYSSMMQDGLGCSLVDSHSVV